MGLFTEKIKKFFSENEFRLILIAGFILVASISFESGYLRGKSVQRSPIIIENSSRSLKNEQEAIVNDKAASSTTQQNSASSEAKLEPEKKACAYMGSKNSDKYHLPTCRWAKQIKQENIVCFSSVEDATAAGYQPDKGCVK